MLLVCFLVSVTCLAVCWERASLTRTCQRASGYCFILVMVWPKHEIEGGMFGQGLDQLASEHTEIHIGTMLDLSGSNRLPPITTAPSVRHFSHPGHADSTANAGMPPAPIACQRRSKNLHVWTGCHTRKIVLEGQVAVGVDLRRAGQILQLRARKEVILSAGAFGSPQLLMLSGIGPKAHLQQHGIPVVHDVPGVGQNLKITSQPA